MCSRHQPLNGADSPTAGAPARYTDPMDKDPVPALSLPDLVPVKVAAQRLKMWPQSVRRAVREGRLRGERVNRDLFIYEDSIKTYRPRRGRPPKR